MAGWLTWLFWLSVLMFVGSIIVVVIIVTRLPQDYLTRQTSLSESFREHHPVMRVILIAAKNVFGLLFVTLGIVMLFTPGQGIMLLDFPGKQKLERRVLGSPRVFQSVNKIRAKTGQSPLEPPAHAQPPNDNPSAV